MAVPLACLLAVGLRRPGLRGLLWLIEARGLANRSEGLGWPGPVDKSEGFRWAGLAQGPSIKVRGWGAGLAQGLSIKVRGWGPGWPANRSEGFWGYGPRAGRPTLFGKPSCEGTTLMSRLLIHVTLRRKLGLTGLGCSRPP